MTAPFHDAELIRSYARAGSEPAFRALVARHIDLVFATALRQVGDRGVAEEVAQNVFVALAKKAPRLIGFETLAGWLHLTTVLEARARVRSELRRKHREQTAAELAEMRGQGSSPFDALLPLLDEALLSLSAGDREILVSRFMQDRSLRDLGARLGIGEEAARKRVARGLEKLGRFFQNRGFALPGTAAALLKAGVEAAPVSLAAGAAQAGMAATVPISGLNLLLLNFMNASHIKVAAVGLLLAAGPLWWQQRANASAARQLAAVQARERETEEVLASLEAERARVVEESSRIRVEKTDAAERLAALKQPRQNPAPVPKVYQWNDTDRLARVPKEIVRSAHLNAVADRQGQLNPHLQTVLQMDGAEARQVQSALDSFLRSVRAAQQQVMREVPPTPQELGGKDASEVRVFEMGDIHDQLGAYRGELFATLEATLGPERFKIFKEGLAGWMPLDEEWQGISSSMAVFDGPHRILFQKPQPDANGGLPWGITRPGSSMRASIELEEVPEMFGAYLQDWLELARSYRAAAPGAALPK